MMQIKINKVNVESSLISSSDKIKVFRFSEDAISKKVIKQIKYKDGFRYYICSATHIKRDNSYKYSEGELLGFSTNDLHKEDVEILVK